MDKETFYNLMFEVSMGIFENFEAQFNHEKITHLNLCDFKKVLTINTLFLENLMDALTRTPFITSIDLSNNNIDSNMIRIFATKYRKTHLIKVNLSFNDISAIGAAYLAEGLKYTQTKSLWLSSNKISSNGTRALFEILKETEITDLELSGNNIGFEELVFFKDYLAENSKNIKLLHLGLSRTNIGSKQSLTVLAEALSYTSITHLFLAENSIDNEMASHFALELQRTHTKLNYLDFSKNFLSFKAKKNAKFIEDFKKTSIRTINLQSNFLPPKLEANLFPLYPQNDPNPVIEKFGPLLFSNYSAVNHEASSPTNISSCEKADINLTNTEASDHLDETKGKLLKCS